VKESGLSRSGWKRRSDGNKQNSYDDTTAAAREIIDAQDQAQEAKTARLRKARLDKEAADLFAHAPAKPN